jgi:hypothetical protein
MITDTVLQVVILQDYTLQDQLMYLKIWAKIGTNIHTTKHTQES